MFQLKKLDLLPKVDGTKDLSVSFENIRVCMNKSGRPGLKLDLVLVEFFPIRKKSFRSVFQFLWYIVFKNCKLKRKGFFVP